MTRTCILFAPSTPDEAPIHLLIDETGQVLARGPLRSGERATEPLRTILVAPGTAATARWLNLPTRNDAQARAAAAIALEEHLAHGVNGVHLALGPLEEDGQRLVIAVDRAEIAAWLDLAARYGLTPVAAAPDYMLLPEPAAGEPPWEARFGARIARRGRRLALGLDETLAPLVLGGHDARRLEDAALEQAIAAAAAHPPINLLQGDFAPGRGDRLAWRDLRRAAVLAVILLATPVLLVVAQAARQEMAARALHRQMEVNVSAMLPKGEPVTDPVAQAQARLARARIGAGGGPAGLASQLFTALQRMDQVQLEQLIAMPDGTMRARITCVNISDIDVLRETLKREGVLLREEGAREEDGRVIGDVILEVRA